MKLFRDVLLLAALVSVAALAPGQAANKGARKAAPKPAAKPAATNQASGPLPGGSGKIGTPYKMGKTGQELHFTLEKAEFATRFLIDSDTFVADPNHRLLVLTFAVQNPLKIDQNFGDSSFKFTVVSPDDENFVAPQRVYHPDRRNPLNVQLKPVQKVRAVAYVVIHPQGPVNKLIVERGDKNPILRYDLRELVKPLENVYAGDKGLGSINPGIALPKVPFELGPFDYTLDSIEEVPRFGDYNPGQASKVIVFRMTLKDVSLVKWWATAVITAKLVSEDGDELRFVETLKNSTDEHLHTNPSPGDELKFRLIFYAPAAAKLKKLVLYSSVSGRSVEIPLGIPVP